jgi:hypothetical protein
MTDSSLLVFELTKEGDQLEIHANEEGIRRLKRHLDLLLAGGPHVHLKTPAWAGSELGEQAQQEGHVVLNHVKILCWR